MGLAELILKNVDFSYGKNKVLQDINIVLEKGVTALLGPNGAGKTTLINIIMALYKPDRGEVIYDNHNVRKLKESYYDYIGYLPQMPQFYKNFTAAQFLEYMGTLKGIEKKELKNKFFLKIFLTFSLHGYIIVDVSLKETNESHAPLAQLVEQ